jgi:transcriptional regulator with PAS, ATPase and Fis domain
MMTTSSIPHDRTPARSDGYYLAADPRSIEVRALAHRVARTNAPVLIVGESGVGKEALARYIHTESLRAGEPMVKINCAAVPHDLLESELFGHERGAFSGAFQRKAGKLELAHGGTLFLDEIGDMSLALQAKLVSVMEDQSFVPLGGTESVPVDARIIVATNRPLERAVRNGDFRKDLYFRLKVIRLSVPPLRERRGDVPLMCEHFLRAYADGQGSSVTKLPSELLDTLKAYHWPGTVRELKHVIQRYVIFPDVEMVLAELSASGLVLAPPPAESAANVHGTLDGNSSAAQIRASDDRSSDDIDEGTTAKQAAKQPTAANNGNDTIDIKIGMGRLRNGKISLKSIATRAAAEVEKRVIFQVLEETRWNRRRAASRLDICYKTLLNRLHQWELEDDIPA